MKNGHGRKMVAPIVVTSVMVAYYILYFLLIWNLVHGIWRALLGVIPLALGIGMVFVCVQRIEEIRSGEEDDLGEY